METIIIDWESEIPDWVTMGFTCGTFINHIIASISGVIVGILQIENGVLKLLEIHPDYRRRGIATLLIKEAYSTTPAEEMDTFEPCGEVEAIFEKLGIKYNVI